VVARSGHGDAGGGGYGRDAHPAVAEHLECVKPYGA
jgi:hypothetical protein